MESGIMIDRPGGMPKTRCIASLAFGTIPISRKKHFLTIAFRINPLYLQREINRMVKPFN